MVVNVLAAAEHPWRLDLVALAGILTGAGTLALAFYTFKLAKSTGRLATETGDDVRAAWRPVLLMSDSIITLERAGSASAVKATGEFLNGGRGPALNTHALVSSSAEANGSEWTPGDIGADQKSAFDLADAFVIDRPDDPEEREARVEVTLTYEDLGGRQYETRMVFADIRTSGEDVTNDETVQWIVDLEKTEVRDLQSRAT